MERPQTKSSKVEIRKARRGGLINQPINQGVARAPVGYQFCGRQQIEQEAAVGAKSSINIFTTYNHRRQQSASVALPVCLPAAVLLQLSVVVGSIHVHRQRLFSSLAEQAVQSAPKGWLTTCAHIMQPVGPLIFAACSPLSKHLLLFPRE